MKNFGLSENLYMYTQKISETNYQHLEEVKHPGPRYYVCFHIKLRGKIEIKFAPETTEFLKNFNPKSIELCFLFQLKLLRNNPKFRKSCAITKSSLGNHSMI